jgi:hypothetical protein
MSNPLATQPDDLGDFSVDGPEIDALPCLKDEPPRFGG